MVSVCEACFSLPAGAAFECFPLTPRSTRGRHFLDRPALRSKSVKARRILGQQQILQPDIVEPGAHKREQAAMLGPPAGAPKGAMPDR